jgi:hypothetical protein
MHETVPAHKEMRVTSRAAPYRNFDTYVVTVELLDRKWEYADEELKRLARPLVGTVLLPLSMSQWLLVSHRPAAGHHTAQVARPWPRPRTTTHPPPRAHTAQRAVAVRCCPPTAWRWRAGPSPTPLGAVSTTGFLFLGVGGMPARDRDEMPTHRGPLGSIPRVHLFYFPLSRPPARPLPRVLGSFVPKAKKA